MAIDERVWTERYRPETLDDVIGNEQQVDVLKGYIDDNSIPNILLEGPAGTGKTASVVAFAKDKFGDNWRSNLIEMNASDDRGIDVVRDDIKSAARQAPAAGYDYKIIYLDEADNLTKDAQSALRRIMEKFSDQTVFFLSCNYMNKLIDPIQSRCSVLPYSRLSDDEIEEILHQIIDEEDIDYEQECLDDIVDYVQGDARRAVHTLQDSVDDGEITEESVNFVNLQANEEQIEEMINLSVNGEIHDSIDMCNREIIPNVTDYGRFCKDLMRVIQSDEDIHDDVRWYALSQVGDLEKSILEGANPEVQVNSFLAKIPVIQYSSIPNYE